MNRAIYPLYAPADEGKVTALLEALRQQGVTVRSAQEEPGKRDALVLFLSESIAADSPVLDTFFRLSAGRELVIPVNLDGCTPPEALQNALMARHALDGTKYSTQELAERIAVAPRSQRKSNLPLALSVAAALILLIVGGVILRKTRQKPAETETEPEPTAVAAEATAVPAPLPTPRMPVINVDPAAIVEVVYVGDEFRYYTAPEGVSPTREAERRGWDSFAYGGWYDDGIHFYSKSDGREYPLYAPADIEWLTMLPNLQYLSLCGVQTELPDLSGLPLLKDVHLGYSRITSLEGLRGSAIRNIEYHGSGVEDFSPLTDCASLQSVNLDFVGSPRVDLSGFHPAELIYIGFGSGYDVEGVDFSCLRACPNLRELSISGFPQIRELSFLQNASALTRLHLDHMDALTDLSGLEQLASLQELKINDCPNLRDISALAGCRSLTTIRLEGEPMEGLRDLSVLGTLPNLQNICLWAPNLQNLDFLRELPTKIRIGLECSLGGVDCSGLEAVATFEELHLACYNASFSTVAPYLQKATVRNMTIFGASELDLSELPKISGSLHLSECGLRDLVGIGKQRFSSLGLVNCQRLTSLEGFRELVKMGTEESDLTVIGCPRLQDWSALRGKKFSTLCLRGVYSLPDLSDLTLKTLQLESIDEEALPDLSWLEALGEKQRTDIRILDMDHITSLQPLFSLRGNKLEVPPQLQEQAQELVESGRFNAYEIVYPDGGWQPYDADVTLLSWEELETLPKSVLKRVRTLTIVGDTLVNDETTEIREERVDGHWEVILQDRATGEETIVDAVGTTLTDLSRLSALTGLENLALWYQPVTNLDGVQALENLRNLEVKHSPDFADASAAFTVQTLERISFSHTGLASLQGVQNLPVLRELHIDDTKVTDFSPLAGFGEELYLNFELPELMTLDELKALPAFILDRIGSIAVAGDWAYRQWEPWWIGNEDRGDGTLVPTLFKNGSDEKMIVETGHITDLSELSFLPNLRDLWLYCQPIADLSGVAALEKLEHIDISYCDELTDPSPLFAHPNLRVVDFNDTKIASIEGIEQMTHLTSLAIAYCEVTDVSPLEKVDYTFCLQEENGGGFNLEVMKPREDLAFTAEDYAPLSAVPAFRRLDVSWVPAKLWMDAVQNVPVFELNAQCGTFTGNEELAAFVAAHPELEEIQITFSDGLTDVSCLLTLKDLRYVEVSDNMPRAIASLGDGYGFELNVRPW